MELIKCEICNIDFKIEDLMPLASVRKNIQQLIAGIL